MTSNTLLNAETDELSGYGSNFPDPIRFYLLPSVLGQLGKPPQVWLLTWPEDPVLDIRPFDLILYYPDQGVFINYVVDRQKDGNDYLGCMGQASVSLSINHPGQAMDWKGMVSADDLDHYKPLEEATSLTLDQFYEQFKDPANTACIHTPQSSWVEVK